MINDPNNLPQFYQLLQQQRRDAFLTFYDQYAGALYGEILQRIHSRNHAEDILLAVFLQAYRELPDTSFEHRHLFTWILVITRSHVAHHYKATSDRY